MGAYPPFKPGQSFNTPLSDLGEMAFRQWVQQNGVPFDVNATGPSDYDMRGYYQGLQQGNPMAAPTEVNVNDGRPHYTDYYKTPLHQTFSAGSQWAGPEAPNWINDHQLVAPNGRVVFDEQQPQGLSALSRYFQR
jgi:hypothetical protein